MKLPSNNNPSVWVKKWSHLIRDKGYVLDLACGYGRHSLMLARSGYYVVSVDKDYKKILDLHRKCEFGLLGRISLLCADLERKYWPLMQIKFDGIIVTNYLFRPHLPRLIDSLRENGILIYETFAIGNERFGRPSNPTFLLQDDELLRLVKGRLKVVAFEQGEVVTPKPACIQRICAQKINL